MSIETTRLDEVQSFKITWGGGGGGGGEVAIGGQAQAVINLIA